MSHDPRMNESCPICERVVSYMRVRHVKDLCAMSHLWMRHVVDMSESCPTYTWGMSHIWMSHVPHVNEWLKGRMSHVSHTNEACFTYEQSCWAIRVVSQMWTRVRSHIWIRVVSHMSHLNTRHEHDAYPCVTWPVFICVTWLVDMNTSHTIQHYRVVSHTIVLYHVTHIAHYGVATVSRVDL